MKDQSGQNWSRLIENYLGCLDNMSGLEFFSLKVTDSTDLMNDIKIPKFYKECIMHFQELCKISQLRDENDIIWCNSKFTFVRRPLNFIHWSRSGVIKVSDLYTNNVLSEDSLRVKLDLINHPTHRANFVFDMIKIKAVFPYHRPLLEEDEDHVRGDEKGNLLQTFFEVPDIGLKSLRDLSSKDIYKIFATKNEPYIKSKDYWSNEMFPGLDLDFKVWFKLNFNSKILPRACKDFNIKLFHGWLGTETKLSRMGYSNGLCRCCKTYQENAEHLLIKCQYRRQIWNVLQTSLKKSFGNFLKISRTEILAGFFKDPDSHTSQIINMCIGVTRYHLWITRNSIRYDEENITFIQCCQILKYKLIDHSNILIKSEKTNSGIRQLLEKVVQDIKETFG